MKAQDILFIIYMLIFFLITNFTLWTPEGKAFALILGLIAIISYLFSRKRENKDNSY